MARFKPMAQSLFSAFLFAAALSIAAQAQSYLYNRADFSTGVLPVAVASGDFNGDHLLDLAIANGIDNTISILLGRPDGTFAPQVT
jgi:hypothetical protein